jgi:ABC-type nitrate/sulfonate/bicarbonate transport system permease component
VRGGPAARRARRRSRLILASVYLALLGGWWLLAEVKEAPDSVWPGPDAVARAIWDGREALIAHTRATLLEATFGFLAGGAFALALAVVGLRLRRVGDVLHRISLALYSLPLIALAPVLVIWFGAGMATKVIIAALASFFPVLVNASQALRGTDRRAVELMEIVGASPMTTFWRVRLPYALPAIVASFTIAAPAAVVGATLSEWVGAEEGLGLMILFSMFSFQVTDLWAAIVVTSLLSLAAYGLFAVLGRVLFPWHASTQGTEVQ